MYWASFGRGGISLPLPMNSRVNELQNGTLYFNSVEMEDVSKIKRNGGIHCAVYSVQDVGAVPTGTCGRYICFSYKYI